MAACENQSEFDEYSQNYRDALDRGLSISGESQEYFAEARIRWTANRLVEHDATVASVMDYGCGVGTAAPFLQDVFAAERLVGVDVSQQSLEEARDRYGSPAVQFMTPQQCTQDCSWDLVYTNGTFHHIPPVERPAAVEFIWSSLRPGGHLAFWENNPWNPGTKLVMSRIPFDRDAITLTAAQAKRLLLNAGFELVTCEFLFIFPRSLRFLRRIEPSFCRLPIGAQYMVLVRKTA